MKRALFILFFAAAYPVASGQFSPAERDTIAKYTRIDYLQMLDQLGIRENELRPGPSGDPLAANAANRFEDKVNFYILPDPLILHNGKQVGTPKHGGRRGVLKLLKTLKERSMGACRKISRPLIGN